MRGAAVELWSCGAVERKVVVVVAVRSQWCDSRIYSPTRLRRNLLTDYLLAAQYSQIACSYSFKMCLRQIYQICQGVIFGVREKNHRKVLTAGGILRIYQHFPEAPSSSARASPTAAHAFDLVLPCHATSTYMHGAVLLPS